MKLYEDVLREAADAYHAGNFKLSESLFDSCIGTQYNDPVALMALGTLHATQQRLGSAITFLRAAVQACPEMSEAWHNLGAVLRQEHHMEESRAAYKAALEGDLQPEMKVDCLAMMAGSYVNEGEPDEAIQWANKALKLDKDNAHARNHLALAQLEKGMWKRGFQNYESRWNLSVQKVHVRPFECPKWDGKPTQKLAIHGEQGLGDEIIFMSCFKDVLEANVGEVVIECAERLIPLFRRSFGVPCYPDHDALIADHPDCTAYIAMGSLPTLFRKTDKDFHRDTFLKPDPERVKYWRSKMEAEGPGPYVVIGWRGGTKNTHDKLRNPYIDLWGPIFKQEATFISGQYTDDAAEISKQHGLIHWQESIDDLDEYAALVGAADLVISVCQTAIHIAGAVGTKCWVLTPSKPAWRYGIKGKMLWYGDHVRLFRQKGEDWTQTIQNVGSRLNADLKRLSNSE